MYRGKYPDPTLQLLRWNINPRLYLVWHGRLPYLPVPSCIVRLLFVNTLSCKTAILSVIVLSACSAPFRMLSYSVRLNLYHDTDPTASQLAEDADDTLFENILADPQHVLHHLLPSRTQHSYKLRPRRHDCSLTVKTDARNFINRHLFKDMYVLVYINLFFKTYFYPHIAHCCVLSTFH